MIPDFQSLMLPMLNLAGDSKEHSLNDIKDILAKQFYLTEQELQQLLPSGKQRIFR